MTGQGPGGAAGSGGSGTGGGGMVTAGPTVGVTPDAVARLAASMDRAVSTAGTVSQAIARIRDRATAAEMSVGQPDPAAISGLIGGIFGGSGSDPDGGALRALMQQAPPVAKEIRARLNHFLACERDNLPISPSLWFTDEPLPDNQKIKDAIAFFNAHIGDGGGFLWSDPAQGGQEVLSNWKQLNPSELDAVLNSLAPDQLRKLNGQLGEGSSWWGAGGPDKTVQAAFTSLILSSAAPGTVGKIRGYLSELKLNPDAQDFGADSNLDWVPVNGRLFGPGGPDPDRNVDQGGAGDCYFLSSLSAIAHRDPGFVMRNIRQNDNGTYTVRLYQNGAPVDVTVTPDLPWNTQQDNFTYAHAPDSQDAPDGLWAALYEKAYAQLSDGYSVIGKGGNPTTAMTSITGQQASWSGWSNGGSDSAPALPDIQAKLSQGYAVTALTPGNNWDQRGEEIVGDHAYAVRRVYTDPGTHQQMIELVNPWGRDGDAQAPQYVHLTQAEFHRDFEETEYLPPGGW
jgi:Calpain family cysteine protease